MACRAVEPEQLAIEVVDEPVAIAGTEHRHDGAPRDVDRGRRRSLARGEGGELSVQLLACASVLPEEDTAPHRPRVSEERRERGAQLLGPKRLALEEGELPAIERLGELRIAVRVGERLEDVHGDGRSERVEARRLAGWLCRCDRKHRLDAERPAVERLEEDRPGSDGGGGRQPQGADGVRDLGGGVGRRLTGVELVPQLDDERAIRLTPEVPRKETARLGPVRRELAGHEEPYR